MSQGAKFSKRGLFLFNLVVRNRILYVQFTNPAGYPPLEHSSRILAAQGWDVLFLGTGAFGARDLQFRSCPRIRTKKMHLVATGAGQKLQYVCFFIWTLYWTLRWRPRWIYASDPLACPVVWLIQKLVDVRVIYHEHDSPNLEYPQSNFMKAVLACRKGLARDAALCVLPQAERLRRFVETTRRTGPTFCVWNCPGRNEVQRAAVAQSQPLILYYHGSIVRARLPPSIIVAATRFNCAIKVRITGYETAGSVGYMGELKYLAATLGNPNLVEACNALSRSELLRTATAAHVGWCAGPLGSDFNLDHLLGASNKVFDYMACGLPLLVSNLPDWTSTFVEPGYGLACNPDDPDSIEAALRWFLDHPTERREMGRKGQNKIKKGWNYETMFADVLAKIENA
jgi:glycosyltransferase involved in cell wall biosynthesis